jgi:hypothetical protein
MLNIHIVKKNDVFFVRADVANIDEVIEHEEKYHTYADALRMVQRLVLSTLKDADNSYFDVMPSDFDVNDHLEEI